MLNAYIEGLARTGLPPDLLKAAIMLVAAFPAAILYRLIPASSPTARHLFSIGVSGTLFCSLFNISGFIQLVGEALAIYALTATMRKSKWGPILAFLGAMGQLSINHIFGQLINKSTANFDHTAPMMVLAIKLTSFAWAAHDGTKPDKDLSEDQRSLAIRKFPGLIEYFGYVFFFGGFLVGPAFEFADYRKFTSAEPPFDKMTSPTLPALKTVAAAVVSLFIFFKFGNVFPYHYALTPEYAKLAFSKRFLYLQLAGGLARTKYYVAWKLSEAACILSGVGYNGIDLKTGKPLWNRVQNIAIRGFELAPNSKLALDNWNKNTGLWLRRYVYLRITPPGTKPSGAAAVATYITSAFWHGFRPGFYLTFISGSLLNVAARTIRRNFRPLFLGSSRLAPLKPIYDVLGWAATIGSINYFAAPFVVHSVENSLTIWKANYYIVHIVLIVVEVGFTYLGFNKVLKKFGQSIGAEYGTQEIRSRVVSKGGRSNGTNGYRKSNDDEVKLMADIVDGTVVPAMAKEAKED
ncbi:hypothetical protein SpCBS45565_g06482 [Spizellomyces sp. 'palustris']|nr:hypothetical protein SpCBS45565_g06482 [Spizellomyces sp. 'palustris']